MWMTLNELCKKAGTSRRSIQCYEKAGLMEPQGRNKYGYLLYSQESLTRAKLIRFYQKAGFRLKEIGGIINGSEKEKLKALEEKLSELKFRKSEIEEIIEQVAEIIRSLKEHEGV